MPSGIYPYAFERICHYCFLPECCELGRQRGGKDNVCPLRITKRLGLTAQQGIDLSRIAEARQYKPHHFLRMAELQAERNQL